jgi:hypothetical protein
MGVHRHALKTIKMGAGFGQQAPLVLAGDAN